MRDRERREIKTFDDLFGKGQSRRWWWGEETMVMHTFLLTSAWKWAAAERGEDTGGEGGLPLLQVVHIIVLAEQSSPILAVCNGGTRDTRCCSLLHSERQDRMPDWIWWGFHCLGCTRPGYRRGAPGVCRDPRGHAGGGETKNTDIKEECVRKINRFLKHKDGGKEGKQTSLECHSSTTKTLLRLIGILNDWLAENNTLCWKEIWF